MRFEKKHGMTKTRTYRAWVEMRRRCLKPNREEYPRYGGRGITICDRWVSSFEEFFSDMGECPAGLTLERKDVNGNYTPNNCKWASLAEQAQNKTTSINLEIGGVTKNLAEWCREYDKPYWLVVRRIRKFGWTALAALTAKSCGQGGALKSLRGEDSYASKLTETKVRAIRLDDRIQRVIAADYGIDQTHVSLIKRRKTWAWLA